MPRNTLAAFDLKAARKVRGLSQVKTAEILCTTQPSVARWEAQGNMPEVFRKLWDLHWQVIGDKTNDARPNKRAGKSSKSRSKVRRSTRRTRSSTEGLPEGQTGSTNEGSVDTTI